MTKLKYEYVMFLQLDEETASTLCNWLPRKLAPQVRIILSMIDKSSQHKALSEKEATPKELEVEPLDLFTRKVHFT